MVLDAEDTDFRNDISGDGLEQFNGQIVCRLAFVTHQAVSYITSVGCEGWA
jgi:hypothetical protein